MSIEVHEIKTLAGMEPIAAEIGQQAGRDFSFLVRYHGKVHRVSVEHIQRGSVKQLLGDIRPAVMYGKVIGPEGGGR